VGVCIFAAPVFYVMRRLSIRKAFLVAYATGFLMALGLGYWTYTTLHDAYSTSVPASLAFVVATMCFMSFYIALPFVCWRFLVGPGDARPAYLPAALSRSLLAASLVFLAEYLRSAGVLSLPWGLLGAGLAGSESIIQFADIVGVLGLSWIVVFISALVFEIVDSLSKSYRTGVYNKFQHFVLPVQMGAIISLAIGIFFLYADRRINAFDTEKKEYDQITIALVQSNVPTTVQWQEGSALSNLNTHLQITEGLLSLKEHDLVIWPEASIHAYLEHDLTAKARLHEFTDTHNIDLILGSLDLEYNQNNELAVYNTVFHFETDNKALNRHRKIELVPFAEYNPFGVFNTFNQIGDAPRYYSRGIEATVIPLTKLNQRKSFSLEPKTGTLICFESLYPWISRKLARDGANFLVNISNDQLFGDFAIEFHFRQARFRAIETRRYLARVATTGITAIYDPLGRIEPGKLERDKQSVLSAKVPLLTTQSVYTRLGDWPLILVSLVTIASWMLFRLRKRYVQVRPGNSPTR
jgi:apolipoprotein N-acyltransferase